MDTIFEDMGQGRPTSSYRSKKRVFKGNQHTKGEPASKRKCSDRPNSCGESSDAHVQRDVVKQTSTFGADFLKIAFLSTSRTLHTISQKVFITPTQNFEYTFITPQTPF